MLNYQPIVILDRDGTINVDTGYVSDPDGLVLIPGAAKAIGDFKRLGLKVIVLSNQSGIGRGYFSLDDLQSVNNKLSELLLLEDSEAVIDEFLICPHSPDDFCGCRKPQVSLLDSLLSRFIRASVEEYKVVLDGKKLSCSWSELCWVVGDKLSDTGVGEALELPHENRFLVLTGNGQSEVKSIESRDLAPLVVDSIVEASASIVVAVNKIS